METRLIVAYVLLVLLACAVAVALRRHATREDRTRRRRLAGEARWEESRRAEKAGEAAAKDR